MVHHSIFLLMQISVDKPSCDAGLNHCLKWHVPEKELFQGAKSNMLFLKNSEM